MSTESVQNCIGFALVTVGLMVFCVLVEILEVIK